MATRREICADWADEHSHSEATEFNPEWAEDYDLTQKEYINAYYNAFIKVYKPGEIPSWRENFKHYLVDVIGWTTESEFSQEYFEL
jgi:hypothetical protein